MSSVLITRPEPGASETAEKLIALGFDPVLAPAFSVVRVPLSVSHKIAATLLTSRNAIPACPPAVHALPAFAVGSATAARAREAGFHEIYDADGDAQALAELTASKLSPEAGPLFLPVGLGQGAELAASLRKRGFRILRRIAYKTVPASAIPAEAQAALRHGSVAAALFFSGETSRQFVRLIQAAGLGQAVSAIEAVSISERTAMALTPLPWRRIRVAPKPNQDAMLALLK